MEGQSVLPNSLPRGARPYRSHLQPACLECRRRKSRCKQVNQSKICVSCQARGTECIYTRSGQETIKRNVPRSVPATNAIREAGTFGAELVHPSENSRIEQWPQRNLPSSSQSTFADSVRALLPGSIHDAMGILSQTDDESPHVIGPTLADDNDELETYLSASSGLQTRRMLRPSSGQARSHPSAWPVSFTTVLRRPLGVNKNQSVASAKCEIIEKLIEPHANNVLEVFLSHANLCFPVFDEAALLRTFSSIKERISPAVLSNLYANALTYWNSSSKLSKEHHPDNRFIWVLATEALYSELFLSPATSTILAMILNIGGRPSTSLFNNGGMVGAVVSLANALGFNHDPSDWKISESEKMFRIKVWWLIVIQDRCLAYGTPLQVQRKQFNVSIPEVDKLYKSSDSPLQILATSIFVAVITLTEVLGQILQHIYTIFDPPTNMTEIFHVDCEQMLVDWEESLKDEIRRIILRGTNLDTPGAANLRLAYLSIKLLLKRLQIGVHKYVERSDEIRPPRNLMQAQRAAEEIVHFVQELKERHLRGFWFPMHAYSLTSAMTFLLRRALDRQNPSRDNVWGIVNDMIKALRFYQREYSWDLADNCLSSYDSLAAKLDSGTADSDSAIIDLDTFMNIDISNLGDMFTDFEDFLNAESDMGQTM